MVLCDEQTMPYIKLYVLYIVSTAVVISSTPEIKSETAMIIDQSLKIVNLKHIKLDDLLLTYVW